jgi:uncharacterized protein YecT (DUF1311 family)
MALIKCPDCGTDVSDAAPACPKCARPIAAARQLSAPARESRKASGGFVVFILVCLGLWIYFQATGSSAPDQQRASTSAGNTELPVEAPTRASSAPVVIVDPAQLYINYNANEVATDRALAGKTIQITAPVKSIDKDFTDSAVLKFATGGEFTDMGVTLDDSEKGAAGDLARGQVVTVRCKTIRRILDSPMASHCRFAKPDDGSTGAPIDSQKDIQSVSAPSAAPTTETTQDATTSAPAVTASVNEYAPQPGGAEAKPATSSTVLRNVIANSAGPSFDCSTVTNITARAICGNAQLSLLDRQMAILYYTHTGYATDSATRSRQRAWIHNRNDTCVADVVCLADQFTKRIQELQP